MAEPVVPTIVITLFALWLIAELCWGKWARIALGCISIIVLASFLAGATFTNRLLTSMQHICLTQIDCSIRAGRIEEVQRALKEYFRTYEETESVKAAVFRMHWALSEHVNSNDGAGEKESPEHGDN